MNRAGRSSLSRATRSLLLFPVLFSGAVALCVYLPIDLWRSSWPTTTGTIITSQRQWHVVTPSNGKGYPVANIVYEYSLAGKTYSSDRYDADGPYGSSLFGSESGIAEILRKYPVGAKVRVYYRETRPSLAVLKPTMSLWMWVYGLVGNFMIGLILRFNWALHRAGYVPWRRNRDFWTRLKANLLGKAPDQAGRTSDITSPSDNK